MLATAQDRSVVVLGMHRSGTSVMTRVINLLGLSLCREEDLYAGPDNPTGHWESRSLIAFNNRLIQLAGGTPLAPAEMAGGWEASAGVAALYDEAYRVFTRAHPAAPWVWKDPRTCLTLPFWRRVLPERPVAVFMHREPVQLARSLERRNGFGKAHGIAQWERYCRCALLGARGMPLVTVGFGELMADPGGVVARVAEDLASVGVPVARDTSEAARFVAAKWALHRHMPLALADDPDATGAQRSLLRAIAGLPAVTASFNPPDLGRESASTTELLSVIRRRGISPPGLRAVAGQLWPAVRRAAGNRLPHRAQPSRA